MAAIPTTSATHGTKGGSKVDTVYTEYTEKISYEVALKINEAGGQLG